MIQLIYRRENAESFVEGLRAGRALKPPEDGWTRDNLIAAAGAIYWAIQWYPPLNHAGDEVDAEAQGEEQADAIHQAHHGSIIVGIELCALAAAAADENSFDEFFEDEFRIDIDSSDQPNECFLLPISGIRKLPF